MSITEIYAHYQDTEKQNHYYNIYTIAVKNINALDVNTGFDNGAISALPLDSSYIFE